MVLQYILVTILVILLIVYTYYKQSFVYWKRRNVPFIKPNFPFGNTDNIFARKKAFFQDVVDLYNKLKAQGHKHGGYYVLTSPNYLVIHPDFVRNVVSKDFNYFVNHGLYHDEDIDPLSAHLFAIEDDKWRSLRAKLTPPFSSGKIKMMFETLKDCSLPLLEEVDRVCENDEPLDIRKAFTCYTTDIIGSTAFGIECNSFKNPDAEFAKVCKQVFALDLVTQIKAMIIAIFPNFARLLRMSYLRSSLIKFFTSAVRNTVEYREKNNQSRADLLQLLINLKNSPNGITMNDIYAESYLFFLAGSETSSTALTFCMFELAKSQVIQDKVREEINDVLGKYDNNNITYDSLLEMKYLEQVLNETLRKYPPGPLIHRKCSENYKVPGTTSVIEKGTKVVICPYALHHDAEFFPEPETFDPERFSDANKENIVPYSFIPFGEGPRTCIGVRFAYCEMKIAIVTILKNFRVRLNKETPEVVTLDPAGFFLLIPLIPILLDLEKI